MLVQDRGEPDFSEGSPLSFLKNKMMDSGSAKILGLREI